MESSIESLKKLKIDQPHDSVIPLLDSYPNKHNSGYNIDTCTTIFIAVLFTIIAKLWKHPDALHLKLYHLSHTYSQFCSRHFGNGVLRTICTI
jgi:hypothetical protein